MPDGERASTTLTGLRTGALHVVVMLFAACLAWWFWGDVASADEIGDATGPEAGAVDEPPSATGLDVVGDELPAVVPVPDPAPAPTPPADVEPAPPSVPAPVPAPAPIPDDVVVVVVDPVPTPAPVPVPRRSERTVTDDPLAEPVDEPTAEPTPEPVDEPADDPAGGDGWDWVEQDRADHEGGDHEGGDEGWGDPDEGVEWVDPELGDPYEGWVDLPPTEADEPEMVVEAEVEHRGEVGHHRREVGEVAVRGDGPSYLPDGSSEDLVTHARRLQVTRQSLALLAGELKHTAKPLPVAQPMTVASSTRPPLRATYIVRTGSRPGPALPALPRPSTAPQVPVSPPSALPPVPLGATGSSSSGAMGSAHGAFDPSQLLERARLWASALGGPGVLNGALYQHQTMLVEVAPAGVPGGRPAFTPD
jgi:hypothetical protein